MPTPDTICPECGSRLQAVRGGRAPRIPAGPLAVGIAGVVGVLALLWIAVALFNQKSSHDGLNGGSASNGYYLRLSGSNTIGAKLAPELVKAWLASKGASDIRDEGRTEGGKPIPESVISAHLDGHDIKVEVRAHGSATAFTDLAAHTADIGMASRPIKDAEVESLASFGDMRSTSNEHVLGLDGVAVVVPPGNSAPKLSRSDLKRIFTGRAGNWSEFNGDDRPIHLYARDDKSGTYDTFKELVLKGDPLGEAKRFEDSAELEEAVAHDPGGIGFIGLPYVNTTRALAISDGSSAALEPTRFSVKTENYALSRRLFLYTPANSTNPAVNEFVVYALSSAGQSVVRAVHFVDLDPTPQPQQPKTTATASTCRLSDRWTGDANAYCKLREGAEQLGTSFRFRSGSGTLDTRATQDLRRVLDLMERSPDRTIILAGFADNFGAYTGNCALSRSRAESVSKALATLGLRVTDMLGFCDELPVRDNSTADGREQNRRVEIFLK